MLAQKPGVGVGRFCARYAQNAMLYALGRKCRELQLQMVLSEGTVRAELRKHAQNQGSRSAAMTWRRRLLILSRKDEA